MPYTGAEYYLNWKMSRNEESSLSETERKVNPGFYRSGAMKNKDSRSTSAVLDDCRKLVPGFSSRPDFSIGNHISINWTDNAVKRNAGARMLRNYAALVTRDTKLFGSAGPEMQRVRNAVNALNNLLNGEMPLKGEHHEVDAEAVDVMLNSAFAEARSACLAYLNSKTGENTPVSRDGKRRVALVDNLAQTLQAFESGCRNGRETVSTAEFLKGNHTAGVVTVLDLLTSPTREIAVSPEEQKDIAAESYAYRQLNGKLAEGRTEYKKYYKKLPAEYDYVADLVSDLGALGETTLSDRKKTMRRLARDVDRAKPQQVQNTRFELEGIFHQVMNLEMNRFSFDSTREALKGERADLLRLTDLGRHLPKLIESYRKIIGKGILCAYTPETLRELEARARVLSEAHAALTNRPAAAGMGQAPAEIRLPFDAEAKLRESRAALGIRDEEGLQKRIKAASGMVRGERVIPETRSRRELEGVSDQFRRSAKAELLNQVEAVLADSSVSARQRRAYEAVREYCRLNAHATKRYSKINEFASGDVDKENRLLQSAIEKLREGGEECREMLNTFIQISGQSTLSPEEEHRRRGWDLRQSDHIDGTNMILRCTREHSGQIKKGKLTVENKRNVPLFAHEPCLGDIRQGKLGDCWFLSSLGCVLEGERGSEEIRNSMLDNGDGTVTVRFFHSWFFGKKESNDPVYVTVNKDVNTSAAQKCLWVQIMEKAASLFIANELDFKMPITGNPVTVPRNVIDYGFVGNGGTTPRAFGMLAGMTYKEMEAVQLQRDYSNLKWSDDKEKTAKSLLNTFTEFERNTGDSFKELEEAHKSLEDQYKNLELFQQDPRLYADTVLKDQDFLDLLNNPEINPVVIEAILNTQLKSMKADIGANSRLIIGKLEKNHSELLKSLDSFIGESRDFKELPPEERDEKRVLQEERSSQYALRAKGFMRYRETILNLTGTCFRKGREFLARMPEYRDLIEGKTNSPIQNAMVREILQTAERGLVQKDSPWWQEMDRLLDQEAEAFSREMNLKDGFDKESLKDSFRQDIQRRLTFYAGKTDQLFLNKFNENFRGAYDAHADRVWDTIMRGKEKNAYMGVGSIGESDSYTIEGVVSKHAFTVMDAYERDGLRFVKIRNPHGAGTVQYNSRGRIGKAVEGSFNIFNTNGVYEIELNHLLERFDNLVTGVKQKDAVPEAQNESGQPRNEAGQPQNVPPQPQNEAEQPQNEAGQLQNKAEQPQNEAGQPQNEPENSEVGDPPRWWKESSLRNDLSGALKGRQEEGIAESREFLALRAAVAELTLKTGNTDMRDEWLSAEYLQVFDRAREYLESLKKPGIQPDETTRQRQETAQKYVDVLSLNNRIGLYRQLSSLTSTLERKVNKVNPAAEKKLKNTASVQKEKKPEIKTEPNRNRVDGSRRRNTYSAAGRKHPAKPGR